MKKFHISDILSITTGHLVSSRNMTGVYEILDYMTGDKLYTHQLPGAQDECAPYILKQHPQLADADISKVSGEYFAIPGNHANWINEQIAKYGEYLEIKKLPKGAHEFINPLAEIIEMKRQGVSGE